MDDHIILKGKGLVAFWEQREPPFYKYGKVESINRFGWVKVEGISNWITQPVKLVLESYAKELSDKLFKANMKYWNESDKLKNEHINKIHQMLYTI